MSAIFQSIDVPPERHADRILAEMLRELARSRSKLRSAIPDAIWKSKDGNPRCYCKAGARASCLTLLV